MRALLMSLLLPTLAMADPVQIPGPDGPLEAEAITVEGATHALIIIPGSGPTDRDGNSPMGLASDTYKLLAQALADQGVASLRIDKRGFGGSTGAVADPDDITIDGYISDTRAWIARARDLAPCVWLAGHSEGGLVALIAATDPPEGLCGVILMAAPGRPIGQILIEQIRANPASASLAPEVEGIVTDLEAGRPRDPKTISPALQPLFRPGLQRYMIDLFSRDPAQIAPGWTGPTLILQGDADQQIRPLDADILAKALPQALRIDLPGATHMMKAEVPERPGATYLDPTLPLHPDLIPAITLFLKDNDPPE